MEQIGIYFKRYDNLGRSEQEIKKTLQIAILSVLGHDVSDLLTLNKIEIINNKIKLKISGPLKSEIVLNKNKIDQKFEEMLKIIGKNKQLKII